MVSTEELALILMLVYKIAVLFSGTLIIFMGYRLFTSGLFSEAGDLDGTFGNNRILLKRAAPGTFFALFGALVLLLNIFIGFSFNSTKDTTRGPKNQHVTVENGDTKPEPSLNPVPPF